MAGYRGMKMEKREQNVGEMVDKMAIGLFERICMDIAKAIGASIFTVAFMVLCIVLYNNSWV